MTCSTSGDKAITMTPTGGLLGANSNVLTSTVLEYSPHKSVSSRITAPLTLIE